MGGLNIAKTTIFTKFTYKFNTISVKISVEFLKNDKNRLKNCKVKGGRGGLGRRKRKRKRGVSF